MCVGLFVDCAATDVREAAIAAGVGVLQFQGDETDADCAAAGYPFIKAIRTSGPIDLPQFEQRFPHASALLFDAWSAGQEGGTGKNVRLVVVAERWFETSDPCGWIDAQQRCRGDRSHSAVRSGCLQRSRGLGERRQGFGKVECSRFLVLNTRWIRMRDND